jgi:diguanylate cyclase (GGDEF)-like protein
MKSVLIVDDDPQFRALMVPILVSRSVKVYEAGTARAASGLVQTEQPDLIVVDGLLPDTDGMTWIQRLRESGVTTPIIFASAFWKDKKTFQRLTNDLGVAAVVQKPVQAAVLAEQIESQLRNIASVDDIEITEELESDLDDELAALRRAYAEGLSEKMSELSRAVDEIGSGTAGAAEQARMLSHRLRGTAGSYGFEELGELAGQIEDSVRDAGSSSGLPPDALNAVRTVLQRMVVLAQGAASPKSVDADDVKTIASERILVVDADASFLEYVQELARRHALEILPAKSADAAMASAQRVKPDAAIIDLNLGTGDAAFRLAKSLRALPGLEGLPIAFTSSKPTIELRMSAAHAGGSLFLAKPVDPIAFTDATQRLLSLGPSRPRVMLLDDDPDFRAQLSLLLQRDGMSVLALSEPTDILEHLTRFRPDLLLLDVQMPKVSGFDICRMLRTANEWRDLPIFFLTGRIGVETRVAAFRAGCDDYLPKPIVPEELLARIHVRLERIRLMQERAEKDALTGVSLRRSFMSRFAAYVSDAARKSTPVSFVLIDIDQFKEVNDGHGHLSGDRVLSGFGKLLSTRFRANDLRGRWGGDEFALCFPNESVETTKGITERLLEELRRMSFEGDIGGRFGVTFTAGVSCFPADGDNVQDLVRVADLRLLAAKRAGRNRVVGRDT